MTPQEAIELIKWTPLMRYEADMEEKSELGQALDMAIAALEKQIPKKPYRDKNNYMFWACPNCKKEIYCDTDYGQQKFDYCTECGQKLKWE